MSKNKKILIVSFFFAPTTRVGGKRFSFLSKFLKEKYPELNILTVSEMYISQRDDSLPFTASVHRTRMFPPAPVKQENILKKILQRLWINYFCLIDPFSGWIIPAFLKGRKIIREKKIDIIIATGPPFSAMVIGYLLSLRSNAKLILDYRDPWSNHDRKFPKIFGKRVAMRLERRVVNRASALVFCSCAMKNNFIDNIGKYADAPYFVITNGFSNGDGIQPLSLGRAQKNIVYAGKLFGERKIDLLAKPLLNIMNEGLISRDNFCFHIFGEVMTEDRKLINKFGLSNLIREHPPVPYEQLIRYLMSADILVLIIGQDMSYSISYKFFDYLSVKRPILAIAPRGSAIAELMDEIDCGRLAFIDSEVSIQQSLEKIIVEDKRYSFSGMGKYNWNEIAKKYINVIDNLTTLAVNENIS